VSLVTGYDNKFEVPSSSDLADINLWQQRMAEQVDKAFTDVTLWSQFMEWGNNRTERGTPAIVRSRGTNQTGFVNTVEKAIIWDTNIYDTYGGAAAGDLILPQQDQRYWWWIGVSLDITGGGAPADARTITRIYTQDTDPATGLILTGNYRYDQYMRGGFDEFITFDGFLRTGGGRQRVTFNHTAGSDRSVVAQSYVWAIRICPDR
jgi:hypothetical protein